MLRCCCVHSEQEGMIIEICGVNKKRWWSFGDGETLKNISSQNFFHLCSYIIQRWRWEREKEVALRNVFSLFRLVRRQSRDIIIIIMIIKQWNKSEEKKRRFLLFRLSVFLDSDLNHVSHLRLLSSKNFSRESLAEGDTMTWKQHTWSSCHQVMTTSNIWLFSFISSLTFFLLSSSALKMKVFRFFLSSSSRIRRPRERRHHKRYWMVIISFVSFHFGASDDEIWIRNEYWSAALNSALSDFTPKAFSHVKRCKCFLHRLVVLY